MHISSIYMTYTFWLVTLEWKTLKVIYSTHDRCMYAILRLSA